MESAAKSRPYRPALREGGRFDPLAAGRPILTFEDVHKCYRADAPVLKGLSLSIARGEFVFVTGPSGAGKSTLLRMLYAAESVDAGRILFLGREVGRLTGASIPFLRRNIGIVFQDFKLVKNWSVLENVALPLEVLGLPERLSRTRVGEALERVGLAGRGSELSGTLSGGEQQRVAVARAIVGEPALLLADEPTGNLDPQLAVDILGLLEEINETGVTVVFATHDRSLLDIRPRRVVVLDDGKATDVPCGLDELAADDAQPEGRLMAQSPVARAFRGAKNDWRLHTLSMFSVAVAFVCLAAALLLVVNVGQVRSRWAETGRASVYLRKNATAEQVAAIERALKASDGVTAVKVVSSEDARRELVGLSNDPVLDALPTDAFPASLEVGVESAVAAERLGKLAAQLSALPAVESVETYGAWSDRLASLLMGGVTASLLLAAVVLAAVVSVVSSTIRLSLQRRRIEVEVMKLVGATDSYVRRPFVVEGAAQGGLGALLAILLLAVLFGIVQSHFDSSLAALLGATPVFLPWTLVLGLIVAGALLGAVAAYGSLRKLLIV